MEEGLDTNDLVRKLYESHQEVSWATRKNNQNMNFNVGALQPKWTSLFKVVYHRLIPITHTSHITLDSAILPYELIEKKGMNAGWIIFNNMINSVKPLKGLWFPAIITQLCINASVKVARNEESQGKADYIYKDINKRIAD